MSLNSNIPKSLKTRKDLFCLAVILFAAACFIGPGLMPGRAFGPYDLLRFQYPWGLFYPTDFKVSNPEPQDFVHQFHPWRQFYSDTLRSGEVPLWNPHQFCGTPFAANDQSAVFYPPNLLFVIFPVFKAFGLSAFLHLFLAGLFMFLFLRVLGAGRAGATVAGLAYMFTGWMVVWMPHASKLDAAVWAPLVFLFFELALRRPGMFWKLMCGLVLGVQFTAGFLQISAYTSYALVIYALVRWFTSRRDDDKVPAARALGALAAAAFFAVAISAVHVFQVLALAMQSQRDALAPHAGFFAQGIPVRMLLTALLPDFFGNPAKMVTTAELGYTENCCYAGAAVLCLALTALLYLKRGSRRFSPALALAAVAALGLLCAAGTPLNLPFYLLFPGAKFLAVNRIIFLFMFGAAALSGLCVQEILRGRAAREALKAALWLIAIAAAGAAAAALTHGTPALAPWKLIAQCSAVFLVSTLGIALVARLAPQTKKIVSTASLAVLVIFDLFQWGAGFIPSAEESSVFKVTPSILFMQEAARRDNGRIHAYTLNEKERLSSGPTLFPNTAMVYGLDDIRGYDSLYLRRYQDFITAVQSSGSRFRLPRSTVVNTSALASPWLDFMAVKYLLASAPVPSNIWFSPIFHTENDLPVYLNIQAFPRGFTAHNWQVLNSDTETLAAMMRPGFRPSHNVALLEPPPGLPANGYPPPAFDPTPRRPSTPARMARPGPGSVVFHATGPGLFVTSEAFAPGWAAEVDGRPAPILRADYTFRAVPLTAPGPHTIIMQYRPMPATAGLWVSLTCMFLFFVLMIVFRKLIVQRNGGKHGF